MSTVAEIWFNYNNAIHQADRLDEVAGNLRNLANSRMETSMQTLSSGWKGENATAFLNKEGILKGDILNTATEVSSAAGEIRRIAAVVRDAELEAERIARERMTT